MRTSLIDVVEYDWKGVFFEGGVLLLECIVRFSVFNAPFSCSKHRVLSSDPSELVPNPSRGNVLRQSD
jgi:hypothetical protein